MFGCRARNARKCRRPEFFSLFSLGKDAFVQEEHQAEQFQDVRGHRGVRGGERKGGRGGNEGGKRGGDGSLAFPRQLEKERDFFFYSFSLSFLGGFAYLFSLVLLLFGVGEGGSQAGFGGVLGSGKEFFGKKVKEVGSCTGKFFRKGMNISLK